MTLAVRRVDGGPEPYAFVAEAAGQPAARVTLARVHVGGEPALAVDELSGPDPAAREITLRAALAAATADGERLVLARGDGTFWRRFDFEPAEQEGWYALPLGGSPPSGAVSP